MKISYKFTFKDGTQKVFRVNLDAESLDVIHCMTERLRGVVGKDAVNNAIICLDMFAKEMPYAVEDSLEELQGLFSVYWKYS